MKKKIQPYPRFNIFIQTNGATYNDSLYSINMLKPFVNNEAISRIFSPTKAKHIKPNWAFDNKVECASNLNKEARSEKRTLKISEFNIFSSLFSDKINTDSSLAYIKKNLEKPSFFSVATNEIKTNPLDTKPFIINQGLKADPIHNGIEETKFFFKKKHQKKLINMYKLEETENNSPAEVKNPQVNSFVFGCVNTLYKLLLNHNQNWINYWNIYSTKIIQIKTLDIDSFSNPLWNSNAVDKASRFGTFEQVADNALSKFKKRYSL